MVSRSTARSLSGSVSVGARRLRTPLACGRGPQAREEPHAVVQFQAIELQQGAEEPVWWHAKPSLVERRTGHHVSPTSMGDVWSSGTWQVASSTAIMNP
jgi:hypothetical protein